MAFHRADPRDWQTTLPWRCMVLKFMAARFKRTKRNTFRSRKNIYCRTSDIRKHKWHTHAGICSNYSSSIAMFMNNTSYFIQSIVPVVGVVAEKFQHLHIKKSLIFFRSDLHTELHLGHVWTGRRLLEILHAWCWIALHHRIKLINVLVNYVFNKNPNDSIYGAVKGCKLFPWNMIFTLV